METGNSQRTPAPAAAKDVDEAALTKRARKRSRYLSPPYTDGQGEDGKQHEQEEPPDVGAAEVVAALHAAALLQEQGLGQVDAPALRFLALYRRRRRTTTFHNLLLQNQLPLALEGDNDAAGGGAGVGHNHKMVNLYAGRAMPMAGDGSPAPAPAPEAALPKKQQKKSQNQSQSRPPVTADAIKQQDAAMENAAPLGDLAVNAANNSVLPKKTKKRNMKKKAGRQGQGQGQVQHLGNPVALVLDFAEGTPLPSKEELLSTFRKFGLVIDSETSIAHGKRSARVAFATRAEAEAAYSSAATLGSAFGPPFAAPRLQDLPPIILDAPPPVPRLPLTDIRKNLEKMISSLTRRSSSFEEVPAAAANSPQVAKPAVGNLVGQMQRLLAKVDKMLQGASSTAHRH